MKTHNSIYSRRRNMVSDAPIILILIGCLVILGVLTGVGIAISLLFKERRNEDDNIDNN